MIMGISIDVSLSAMWKSYRAFRKGKVASRELLVFAYFLEDNLSRLSLELVDGTYRHGAYRTFIATDSKRRCIAVAPFRDRVVHRLLYDYLVRIFNDQFFFDVWSCRQGKGLIAAVHRTRQLAKRYRHGYFWRFDIEKYFDSVDHSLLLGLVGRCLQNDILAQAIIKKVVSSYHSARGKGKGIPIGNLTSQIFANIYLHELDRFLKHHLMIKDDLRYGDDLVLFSADLAEIMDWKSRVTDFLEHSLKLRLHRVNNVVGQVEDGVKYLGYCHNNIRWLILIIFCGHCCNSMNKINKGYTAGVFHPDARPAKGVDIRPLAERSEDEQIALFYQIQDLVAEKRDLLRSKNEESSEQPARAITVKKVQGRFVPIKQMQLEEIGHRLVDIRLQEINQQLANLGQVPGLEDAYREKVIEAFGLARLSIRMDELEGENAQLTAEIDNLVTTESAGKAGVVRKGAQMEIDKRKEQIQKNTDNLQAVDGYESGHEIVRLREIKRQNEALANGQIIEFPTIKATIDEGLSHLRHQQPFLLAGHLGSGKTEVARHMAKLFMLEQGVDYNPAEESDLGEVYKRLQPEFFSGGDEASIYDLIGKLKLVGKDVGNEEELSRRMLQAQAFISQKNLDIPEEELTSVLLGKNDVTETIFNYGPLGRAIRDGRPIVIDEINLVPPEVLGRINDILLKKVGDKVRLQENGDESFEIKPGFAVLATCNLGKQYAGIKDVNAAFKSRWVAKEVDYPQVEETYDLILASLVRKDRVRLPPNFPADQFEKLADLAIAVREIQEIFSGQTVGRRFMSLASGVEAEQTELKSAVVSTRDLVRKILEVWKKGNFKDQLDEVLARNILAGEVWSASDQKFMAELFIRRGFFDKWKESDFIKIGVKSVRQPELDALQVATHLSDYKVADKKFGELQAQAHGQASLVRADLLVGTKK